MAQGQAPSCSRLPCPHRGMLCSRLSVPTQVAQCVSKNSFPAPNITWHKNGQELKQEEKSELHGDGEPHLACLGEALGHLSYLGLH